MVHGQVGMCYKLVHFYSQLAWHGKNGYLRSSPNDSWQEAAPLHILAFIPL